MQELQGISPKCLVTKGVKAEDLLSLQYFCVAFSTTGLWCVFSPLARAERPTAIMQANNKATSVTITGKRNLVATSRTS